VSKVAHHVYFGIVVWSLTGLLVARGETGTGALAARDKKFVLNVVQDGMTEVKLGEIARERATSPLLKNFGEEMIRDHSRSDDNLKNIAAQKSLVVPVVLDQQHQGTIDALVKLNESQFDSAYLDQMIEGHKKALKTISAEQSTTDGDLRRWTVDNLTMVKSHLDMALQIKDKIAH